MHQWVKKGLRSQRKFISAWSNVWTRKEQGKSVTKPKDILMEMKNFYQKLYNEGKTEDIDKTNYSNIEKEIPKLNDAQNTELERDISLEELQMKL